MSLSLLVLNELALNGAVKAAQNCIGNFSGAIEKEAPAEMASYSADKNLGAVDALVAHTIGAGVGHQMGKVEDALSIKSNFLAAGTKPTFSMHDVDESSITGFHGISPTAMPQFGHSGMGMSAA